MAKLPKMTVRLRFHAFDSWLIRIMSISVLILFFWAFFQNLDTGRDFDESIDRFNALSDRYEAYIVGLEGDE